MDIYEELDNRYDELTDQRAEIYEDLAINRNNLLVATVAAALDAPNQARWTHIADQLHAWCTQADDVLVAIEDELNEIRGGESAIPTIRHLVNEITVQS